MTNELVKDRLIVALDVSSKEQALELVDKLEDSVNYYKVGMQLYNSEGPDMVKELLNRGKKVFLDLKLHDIPNTVAQAGAVLTHLGVNIFNVHVAGGRLMMKEAVEKSKATALKLGIEPPIIIGVTVLTSINQGDFQKDLGYTCSIQDKVREWSQMAQEAGLDGVVASAEELPIIREVCGKDFLVITPGIRPSWAAANDQQRIVTPAEAIRGGASHIVVGRPITAHENPKEAALKILVEMESGL